MTSFHNTRFRDHPVKLIGGRVRTGKRGYFFTKYIISLDNLLPQDMVIAYVGLKGIGQNTRLRTEKTLITNYSHHYVIGTIQGVA